MPAIGSDQPTSNHNTSSISSYHDTAPHHPLRLLTGNSLSILPSTTATTARTTTANSIASIILSNFLPSDTIALPTVEPPSIESLVVASSAEDFSNFHDVTFDFFDEDENLFGSPLAFDASDNGLWNGRFVPPPPRPPFFVDEPVLSDGLTTCDLCSWAMPTKSTFIFEGTIEKASELGWPLTLIIVSILSALLGAIIMITVVRCRSGGQHSRGRPHLRWKDKVEDNLTKLRASNWRQQAQNRSNSLKKSSNNRNETHVQWWSRNKRPNNNNHLRRSNIYTAHPADSIRGLHQPTLSASSSLTAMGAAVVVPATAGAATSQATITAGNLQQQQHQYYHQQQHMHQQFQPHALAHQQPQPQQQQHDYEYEHEYHQPHDLQLQLQQPHQEHHHHQRQNSSSISSSSATSTPSLTTTITTMMPLPMQLQQQQHDSGNWQNGSTMAVAS